MITGAHAILYSTDAEADRAFFRHLLELPFADAGHGWLVFALPPAELAVHPAERSGAQELYLTCDDVAAFVERMTAAGVACTVPVAEQWGSITQVTLPGGGSLGVYEPTHPSPTREVPA
jgi:hypothetical protein